jgi:hypothetical protein
MDLNRIKPRPSPIAVYYSRYKILNLFRELNFSYGVEIGTEQGVYAKRICDSNPQLKLFCIDPYDHGLYYKNQLKEESELQEIKSYAHSKLSGRNCEFYEMTSMEAVTHFDDDSLDFAFIDGNHNYQYVMDDIVHWSKKVKPGGIVYGHDYWNNNDVVQAIHEYTVSRKIDPWFILHAGGAMLDCWMYIRQEEDLIF